MSKNGIGQQIAKLRRAAGITQEELGKAAGVSTQAVSRWECGGAPDVELLPAIADKLNVSIDMLFGRDAEGHMDLHRQLYEAIRQTPEENRMNVICDYIYTMQKADVISHTQELVSIEDMMSAFKPTDRRSAADPYRIAWQMQMDHDRGTMAYGMAEDMRFALVMPEPEKGYASMLKKPEAYRELFGLLTKPHYLDMLIVVYMRKTEEHFTDRMAAAELGITAAEARTILDDLYLHYMVRRIEVTDDQGTIGVYCGKMGGAIEQFLFFCGQVMRSEEDVVIGVNIRKKPRLNAVPGTGSLLPDWKIRSSLSDGFEIEDRGILLEDME